jgi:Protein of unknown function (DUF3349)
VDRFVAFIRAGYPQGVRQSDYRALLALPRRRLCDDEIAELARELVARGELKLNIDIADIGAAITRITDELPSAADLERVQRRLGGDWLVRCLLTLVGVAPRLSSACELRIRRASNLGRVAVHRGGRFRQLGSTSSGRTRNPRLCSRCSSPVPRSKASPAAAS